MADGDLRDWSSFLEYAPVPESMWRDLCAKLAGLKDPGFITGDWSVEYPPVADGWGDEMAKRVTFPAAAMRDSAF